MTDLTCRLVVEPKDERHHGHYDGRVDVGEPPPGRVLVQEVRGLPRGRHRRGGVGGGGAAAAQAALQVEAAGQDLERKFFV